MADQAETAGTPSPATAAQSVGAQPVGFKGWYAVVMMAVVVMLAQVDRNIISLMVQPMKRDLGLSDTEIGLLEAVPVLVLLLNRLLGAVERIRGAADDTLGGGVALIGELNNTPELLETTDDVIKEVANGAVRYAGPVSKLLG